MKTIQISLIVLVALYFIVYIILAFCTKKPIKTIAYNALVGCILLAIINLTAFFTGVHIPVNPYSLGVSAAGGGVGILLLLVLKIIII